jgi:hypothetical protein
MCIADEGPHLHISVCVGHIIVVAVCMHEQSRLRGVAPQKLTAVIGVATLHRRPGTLKTGYKTVIWC